MAKSALLETHLAPWFTSKAPFQIPSTGRESLVKFLPWLDLILLIFLLPAVLAILALGSLIGNVSTAVGISTGPLYWTSLVFLAIQVVLMAIALPGLFRRQRRGWVLMYYGTLIGVVYNFFDWVNTPAAVVGLIWAMLLSVVSLYFIFQVRSHYK